VYAGYRNRWRTQEEWIDGVRVVRVWSYVAPNAGTVRRIIGFLTYVASAVLASLRIERPDVVIATSPQFFCGWAGVFVSRLKCRPLVLEIRDIWPESIVAVGAMRSRLLLRMLEYLERRMYRAADHIVAVGDGYRDNILQKVDVGDRISVITNGVDLRQFSLRRPDDAFLREHGLSGSFVCSYLGTIGMAHGLDVVVRAATQLRERGRKDIRFCLVGDGADRARLEELTCAAGVEELVVFAGRQPKDRIPALLASSDACLIHLRSCELFGTVIPSKIFETMAMGRPMIMGVRGEARDIVHRAEAGLDMEPDSPESLAACVMRLADDPELTLRLSASAREFVSEHYDRDWLARRLLKTLHETAGLAFEPREVPVVAPAPDVGEALVTADA
jgi:glycosyltransferase involved in cell wall biosynthesis